MGEKQYRNTAFLTELLVNILVFAVSCAVLAGVFARAFNVVRQNRQQSQAGTEVYAVVEALRANQNASLGSEEQPLQIHYDENWQYAQGDARYTIEVRCAGEAQPAGVLYRLVATAHDNTSGEQLYRLETELYRSSEGGDAA